jgi:predicted amidohydrolase YtcJ
MRLTPLRLVALVALAGLAAPLALRAQAADLLVTNARIYTADSLRPTAAAMAVRAGRVVWVGEAAGAAPYRGPATRVVDLAGRTVIPGMIDAHAHLFGLGESLRSVDLVGTRSYDEVVQRVAERARTLPAGSWVTGRGWDQNDWPEQRFPTHEALSRAVPDHPVLLERVDGHAMLANAAAMRVAGIGRATRDPAGGKVLRDAAGAPTGVLVDNAQSLVEGRVPAPTVAERREIALAAVKEANRWGLTGVHEAGVGRNVIDAYEALAREGRFTLRNYVMVSGSDEPSLRHYLARGPQSALYDGHLWVRAVKLYADGALGSRGAALIKPYTDDPHNRGLLVTTPARLRDVARRAYAAGFQVNVHAIGDQANRTALDVIASAVGPTGGTRDHRWRVEHAQVLDPADIPRFARLRAIPAMQASHQTSDMPWAEQRLGPERVKTAYAWRSLLATGVIVPNGSDFPVEQVNPLLSFHAAFTRESPDNQPPGGWHPEQRMTREEALKSMTIWAAYAGFQDQLLGSLAAGKYADFVVLDRDIMQAAPADVLKANVLSTWVGGKAVYEKK